jgi:hypothetical protein
MYCVHRQLCTVYTDSYVLCTQTAMYCVHRQLCTVYTDSYADADALHDDQTWLGRIIIPPRSN